MSQRGLRSGEDLTIEFHPSHHAGPMVPACLVGRTSEQVLLTAGIDRLYGFDAEQLNQNRQVIGRWGAQTRSRHRGEFAPSACARSPGYSWT